MAPPPAALPGRDVLPVCSAPPAITAQDVESWLGYGPQHEDLFPLDPLYLEFARKELGTRLIGRAECAAFFSRRLFIDYCLAVNDAFLEAKMLKEGEDEGSGYADAATVCANLSDVSGVAKDLLRKLGQLNRFEEALVIHNYRTGPSRHPNWRQDMHELQRLLTALAGDAANGADLAAGEIKSGRSKAALTRLITRVAKALEVNGISPDTKPSGPLHTLCGIALKVPEFREIFGDPKALKDSIRSALKGAQSDDRETSDRFLQALFRP